ncbi:MAG: DNA polymerase IV [Calditrichaeota bacterium]|nr:DNA polymerase IV [Calditrichota bacterium]
MNESRVILHMDMDAFFAAVEQRDNPDYRGKPVIVGADPQGGKGRGVVSTCSYEAREYGVHSAMPIRTAYKLCPNGIYVWPHGKLYSQVSKQVFEILYEFTDEIEPLSIDEAFMDVTGSIRLFGEGRTIARLIKNRIKEKLDLIASVGVAPTKYLAKIASDLEKPDGLVVVEPGKIDEFLHPLPISRLWGAGKQTQKALHKMGIDTIGQLAAYPEDILRKKLGKMGDHFYKLAHGIDNRRVQTGHGVKSVSNEHTFFKDLQDGVKLRKRLSALCEKVGFRLRNQKLAGKTIHLKLRYSDFSTITRNKTISNTTNETEKIYKTITTLFEKNYIKGQAIRLIGVGVSGFKKQESEQLTIFENTDKKGKELDALEDEIRLKFGTKLINRADSLGAYNHDDFED